MGRGKHGEGSVYYRASRKQWVAVADLGWAGGHRDRREFTGKTKAAARDKRAEFLHKRAAGFTPQRGRGQDTAEWLEHWVTHIAPGGVEASTLASYRAAVMNYAVPFFARTGLHDLAEEDIEAWHAWLARYKSRTGGRLSASTMVKAHRILARALNVAVRRGHLPRNPCANVPPPRARSREMTPPSGAEVALILDRCRTWPNGARWVLAIATGLRQGEALALRWRDVKLDGPVPQMTIRASRSRAAGEWVVKPPKTAKGRRTVQLPEAAAAALRAHRAAQEVASLDGLVFTTRRGQPVHGRADWADWQALLADLGLPAYRVHDLRHLAAVLLLQEGVDVRVVQEILGHASSVITRDVYQHVTDRLQAQAAAAMDKALGGWE